jgi:hypothetical protein
VVVKSGGGVGAGGHQDLFFLEFGKVFGLRHSKFTPISF